MFQWRPRVATFGGGIPGRRGASRVFMKTDSNFESGYCFPAGSFADSGDVPSSEDLCCATVFGFPTRVATLVKPQCGRTCEGPYPASACQLQGVQAQPWQETTAEVKLGVCLGPRDRHSRIRRLSLWSSSSVPKAVLTSLLQLLLFRLPGVMAQAQQVAQHETTVKMKVGVRSVCEDPQGDLYFNGTTGQTFGSSPPQLVGLLQR